MALSQIAILKIRTYTVCEYIVED